VKGAIAIALVVVAVVVAGCGRADYSSDVSFADITAVIADAGLEVCSTDTTDTPPPGAAEERAYEVDRDCATDDGRALVVATAYDSASDRDAAARRFEVQSRPSANGAIWTLGPFTVRVSGGRDADAVDALTNALDARGAR
jgi:hypothetical protein